MLPPPALITTLTPPTRPLPPSRPPPPPVADGSPRPPLFGPLFVVGTREGGRVLVQEVSTEDWAAGPAPRTCPPTIRIN